MTQLDIGYLGVRIFFVLSGFLITGILLKELSRTGAIDVVRFYIRRTFRIFPPYFFFLAIVATSFQVGLIKLNPGDLLHAVTYTTNYHYPNRAWALNHTWSLSVEEQFYLFWPGLLLLAGARLGFKCALASLLLCPLFRIAYYRMDLGIPIGDPLETILDSLATGCVLARYRNVIWENGLYRKILSSRWFLLIPILVLEMSMLHGRPRSNFIFGYTVMNLGVAMSMDWCMRFSEGYIGRILNSKPLAAIGIISYSMYLWQQLFLGQDLHFSLPLGLVYTFAAATFSYFTIERPFLEIRDIVDEWWTVDRRNPLIANEVRSLGRAETINS